MSEANSKWSRTCPGAIPSICKLVKVVVYSTQKRRIAMMRVVVLSLSGVLDAMVQNAVTKEDLENEIFSMDCSRKYIMQDTIRDILAKQSGKQTEKIPKSVVSKLREHLKNA